VPLGTLCAYLCCRGNATSLALDEPGVFAIRDHRGRDWLCAVSEQSAEDGLPYLSASLLRLQALAHRHGFDTAGTHVVRAAVDRLEELAGHMLLCGWPSSEETVARLAQAGWRQTRWTWALGEPVRCTVSDGTRSVEGAGHTQAEALWRAAQEALGEEPEEAR
jgi:hypothetical protein